MYVQSNLRSAQMLLPDSVKDHELRNFEEYLSHNELELAMDELDRFGQSHDCPGGFWRSLERAADTMKLQDKAREFRQKFLDAI